MEYLPKEHALDLMNICIEIAVPIIPRIYGIHKIKVIRSICFFWNRHMPNPGTTLIFMWEAVESNDPKELSTAQTEFAFDSVPIGIFAVSFCATVCVYVDTDSIRNYVDTYAMVQKIYICIFIWTTSVKHIVKPNSEYIFI